MQQSMSEIKYALLYCLTESEKAQIIDYLENKTSQQDPKVLKRLEMIESILGNMIETLQELVDLINDAPKPDLGEKK